jgi:hypothetical protein
LIIKKPGIIPIIIITVPTILFSGIKKFIIRAIKLKKIMPKIEFSEKFSLFKKSFVNANLKKIFK